MTPENLARSMRQEANKLEARALDYEHVAQELREKAKSLRRRAARTDTAAYNHAPPEAHPWRSRI